MISPSQEKKFSDPSVFTLFYRYTYKLNIFNEYDYELLLGLIWQMEARSGGGVGVGEKFSGLIWVTASSTSNQKYPGR